MLSGVIAKNDREYVRNGIINSDVRSTRFTMDDTTGIALQIAVQYQKGDQAVFESYTAAGTTEGGQALGIVSYKVKIADESIVMVSRIDGNFINLVPNKPGVTSAVIFGLTSEGKSLVIGSIPITVDAARRPSMFSVQLNKNTLDLNDSNDYVAVRFSYLDQYGELMPNTPVTYTLGFGTGITYTGTSYSFDSLMITPADITEVQGYYLDATFRCGALTMKSRIELLNSGFDKPEEPMAPVALVIENCSYTAGELGKLRFTLFDENGNDITSELGNKLNGTLTFELVDGDLDTRIGREDAFRLVGK